MHFLTFCDNILNMKKLTEKEKAIKKRRREKIKQYKRQLHSEIFELDNELRYNENGDALIECKIGKAENIFDKYDLAKERTITDEFEKYLLDEVEIVPMDENVAIKMYVDENFTEENEKQVKRAIKNHFSFKITKDIVKMKSNDIWAIIFFVLGLVSLAVSPFIYQWCENTYLPFYECCLILIWFFLYEGGYMAFFDRNDIREHRYNMLRLYNAEITFAKIQAPNLAPLNAMPQVSTPDDKPTKKITKKTNHKQLFSLFGKFNKKK